MPSPRPIQWNDWARPTYASRPIFPQINNVNMRGFGLGLPDTIPPDFKRLGFEPLDIYDDPGKWGKLDQLKMLGKAASFGGELFDELYRGNTKYEPNWKIGGMPDLPGIGGLSKTKSAIDAAKKASRHEAAITRLEDKVVRDIVAESKTPRPLAPAAGVSPVNPIRDPLPNFTRTDEGFITTPTRTAGKKVYKVINGELVEVAPPRTDAPSISGDAIPTTRRMTEGPVKREILEPAARMVSRPSLNYQKQQIAELQNQLFPPSKQKLLPAAGPRFEAGEKGVRDLRSLDIPRGGSQDLTPIPGLPELPPIPATTPPKSTLPQLPSLGNKAFIPPVVPGAKDFFRSIETRLRADSPAGNKIADAYTAFRVDKGVIAGGWESKLDDALGHLKDKEVEQVVDALESRTIMHNPKLEEARQKMVALDSEITGTAAKEKLKMRSKSGKENVDFQPLEGYWPRIYEHGFWDNPTNIINALQKRGYKADQAASIVSRAQLHGGRLIDEGAVRMSRKKGMKLKDPQHARQINLPGYLKTKEAYRLHIRDMADRIAAKQYFGDLDIAGGEFGALVEQTKNKDEMKRLLNRVFEREGDVPMHGDRKLSNAVLTAGTLAHLSNFLINNPLQLAMSATKAPKAIPAGIKAAFNRTPRLKAATKSGSLVPIHSDALAGTEGLTNKAAHFANKYFGIETSEKFTRSVSSAMGQNEATRLFARLKKNPTSDKIRNQIEELTMTPANELLAQSSLTEKQLNRAGGMFSARTQGRAQSFDLPYHLTGGTGAPIKNVATQFAKYSMVQPRLLMEAARRKPLTTAASGALSYYGGSEAIGAIKDVKKAAVASMSPDKTFPEAYKENRDKRGEFGPKRFAKTLAESWAFGYPAQVMSDANRAGIKGAVIGALPPIAGDAINIGEAAVKVAKAEDPKEQARLTAQFLARYVPLIGQDAANTLLAKEVSKFRSFKKFKSL